jgi:hypothetical protein
LPGSDAAAHKRVRPPPELSSSPSGFVVTAARGLREVMLVMASLMLGVVFAGGHQVRH